MSLRALARSKSSGWGHNRVAFVSRAGGNYRQSLGKDRSANKTGPLHDLSDFHFADGTAAPETHTQQVWKLKRETENLRIQRLESEMVDLHLKWMDKEKNN